MTFVMAASTIQSMTAMMTLETVKGGSKELTLNTKISKTTAHVTTAAQQQRHIKQQYQFDHSINNVR